MSIQPRPGIMDIRPYTPGAADAPGVTNPVKLSSNENPLGCSPKARAAYEAVAGSLNLYPDGAAKALRAAIGEVEGVDPERIVCGCGSDEILQLIGRAYLQPGDRVVQSQYGFLVYRLVTMQSGAELVSARETGCRADVDALLEVAGDDARVVFLANPNNPTGTWIPDAEVRRLRAALPETTLLVLDAAYAEYADDPAYESGMALAGERDDVIVTRTFSKIHGLAGLRVGWAYADPSIIGALNRVRGPFNVNLPALAAAAAAIRDTDFIARSRAHNAQWLPWLRQQIGGLGLEVTPSAGNFVLIHFPDTPGKTAADADRFLTARGLILRPLQPYGLPNALRLTVGLEAHNRAVVQALAEFLKD